MDDQTFFNHLPLRLTDQQKAAVRAVNGPTLLLAVPGSGKTTVLVTRVGYMIHVCGIAPEQILTVTYTVAATRDMQSRFASLFGEETASGLAFRTINGICASIILYYSRQLGRPAFSLITDEKQTGRMLSGIYQEKTGDYPTEYDLKNLRTLITYIKNMRLYDDPEAMHRLDEKHAIPLSEIYQAYQKQLRSRQQMDYDDQMIYAYNILLRAPEVLAYYQQCYPYICVDEAQDTSRIQHEIIALLASGRENLFMVGDEDQSIYGFRAAYPQALLDFEKNHPHARVLLMEENYRSAAPIVEAADRFIRKNALRHPKRMQAVRTDMTGSSTDDTPTVRKITLKGRKAQYTWLKKVAEGCRTETAVLYRNNESMLPLVDLFEREGIPYRIRNAEVGFFSHRTVLDISNIIRLAANPSDADAFSQVYYKLGMYLRRQDAMQICEISGSKGISVFEAALKHMHLDPAAQRRLRLVRTQLGKLLEDTGDEAIERIRKEIGYGDYLDRAGIGDGRLFILKAIGTREISGESLLIRLEQLKDILENKPMPADCPLILSTIHASKGLEYDTVYLMDVADGIFPETVPPDLKHMGRDEQEAFEEERRLFYVGATRAKNRLNIFETPAKSVLIREFFEEKKAPRKKQAVRPSQTSHTKLQIPDPTGLQAFTDQLAEGVLVRHSKFGEGVITAMDGQMVRILFQDRDRLFNITILFANQQLELL